MRTHGKRKNPAKEPSLFDLENLDPAAALAELTGPQAREFAPSTLSELKSTYGLDVLDVSNLEDRPEQVKFAHIFFARTEQGMIGAVLRKGTGRGKSFDALIVAARELSHQQRVLIVTSRNMLVRQFAEYARAIFQIDPENVVEHSNARIAVSKRAALHTDKNARLVVATGETIRNDLANGDLDLSNYSLIILDEALHNTVGDYAYVSILTAVHKAKIAFLALDATPANTKEELSALGKRYQLDPASDFFNVKGDTDYHPIPVRVAASKQVSQAAWNIAAQIATTASTLARPSTESTYLERTPAMVLFYAIRDAAVQTLTQPISQIKLKDCLRQDFSSTQIAFKNCAKGVISDAYRGHAPSGILGKLVKTIDHDRFQELVMTLARAPEAKIGSEMARLIVGQAACDFAKSVQARLLMIETALNPKADNFGDLIQESTQSVIGPMRGLSVEIGKCLSIGGLALADEGKFIRRFACEAGELARYHEELTSYGAIYFLYKYALKLNDYRDRLKRGAHVRGFEAALYSPESALLATAQKLASGSAFAELLSVSGSSNAKLAPFKERLNQAQLEELYKGKLVTPKEWKTFNLIAQELAHNPNSRILVFIDQVDAAAQYAEAIELWSHDAVSSAELNKPILTQHISGTGSMGKNMREQRKAQFERGEIQVLVITSVAIEGAHFEGANVLIALSHLSNPGKLKQLMGRAGHGKDEATIYQIVAESSPDSRRLERAAERMQAAEDTLDLMAQVPN